MSLFSSFLKRQSRPHSSRRTKRQRTSRRLRLEPLECRSLLAQLAVTTPLDVVDADDGLLSLREAVIEANASPGLDTIHVPAGTYALTLAGVGEDAALTGDLDLTGRVSIQGAGAGATIIDGAGLDRVFDAHESSSVSISHVTITGGDATGSTGGGISSHQGTLTVSNCIFADNVANAGGPFTTSERQ